LLLPGQLAVKLADSRPVNVIVQLPAVSVPLQVFPLVLSVTVTTVLPVKAALLVVSSTVKDTFTFSRLVPAAAPVMVVAEARGVR